MERIAQSLAQFEQDFTTAAEWFVVWLALVLIVGTAALIIRAIGPSPAERRRVERRRLEAELRRRELAAVRRRERIAEARLIFPAAGHDTRPA